MSWHMVTINEIIGRNKNNEHRMLLRLLGNLTIEDEKILRVGLLENMGIKDVQLNLTTKRLLVIFDPTLVDVNTIAFKVGQLGYRYVKRT